ncbi:MULTISPECIES: hypothetical protein [unclassified Paenibacillus]|uniref:hypothetical protein n=1 Tax=unclassified Paenibacillus TaxID=185978 RepID=UPI002785F72C|nr:MULTISPECIES: hypothetical protein [unclassified Paenibacillus]MDQ0899546.1 AcrR family transcriptional regulator [Paenibacillus sp. V4I7]MDQ0914503.1 AcrR family transcriptional regulator [Paenibacillus sp. V4I5]
MARTKEFDEDAVLLKAMLLFWEQGYEKTSMMDLDSHLGITREACMTPLAISIPCISRR